MCLTNAGLLATATWVVHRVEGADEPDCDHIGYTPFTIRKEICGSDGQTYSSEKHLEFENCLYRRGTEIASARLAVLPSNVFRT
jgi:hypothetical protein